MAHMKTAISIPTPLFEQAESLARHMHISRSQLFAQAMEAFLAQHQNHQILEQLNAAYTEEPDAEEAARLARMHPKHQQLLATEEPW